MTLAASWFRPAILLAALTCACANVQTRSQEAPESGSGSDSGSGASSAGSMRGVLAPLAPTGLSIRPAAYSGELRLVEVQPPGTLVSAGEVIARFEMRSIEEQLADAERELESARTSHEGLLERNRIAAEAAESRQKRTKAALERARRSFAGYQEHERSFADRGDEMARMRSTYRVEDQVDELDQLEAMYESDELTDATEEIVLKRARRDLELTRLSNELSEDRRKYDNDLTEKLELEARTEALHKKEEELAHLLRTQAIDALSRADAETQSAAKLAKQERTLERLRADAEAMVVRAPANGVLLHGKRSNYRPGASPSSFEVGDTVKPRDEAFLVATPSAMAVELTIPEGRIGALPSGTEVLVRPLTKNDTQLGGTLEISDYPTGRKGEEATFSGRVELSFAPADLRYGMHADVVVAGAAK